MNLTSLAFFRKGVTATGVSAAFVIFSLVGRFRPFESVVPWFLAVFNSFPHFKSASRSTFC